MPRVRTCRYVGCHRLAEFPYHYCNVHIKLEQDYINRRQSHYSRRQQWKYNHITRYATPEKAEQNKFYHSKLWKELRKIVLQRDNHLCQYCLAVGRYTQGNIVDHVVPIEFDQSKMKLGSNLVTCCRHCHNIKTRWEQQYYGTGKGNSLKDVSEIKDFKIIARLMKQI